MGAPVGRFRSLWFQLVNTQKSLDLEATQYKPPQISASGSSTPPTDIMIMHQNHHRNFSPDTSSMTPIVSLQRSRFAPSIGSSIPMAASGTPVTVKEAGQKINHHLLQSCALRAQDEPENALEEANFGFYLAEERKLYHLQSKSQFYRGLCLMDLERYKEADEAFTRAASVRWWAWRVAELKTQAEHKIAQAEKRRIMAERQMSLRDLEVSQRP